MVLKVCKLAQSTERTLKVGEEWTSPAESIRGHQLVNFWVWSSHDGKFAIEWAGEDDDHKPLAFNALPDAPAEEVPVEADRLRFLTAAVKGCFIRVRFTALATQTAPFRITTIAFHPGYDGLPWTQDDTSARDMLICTELSHNDAALKRNESWVSQPEDVASYTQLDVTFWAPEGAVVTISWSMDGIEFSDLNQFSVMYTRGAPTIHTTTPVLGRYARASVSARRDLVVPFSLNVLAYLAGGSESVQATGGASALSGAWNPRAGWGLRTQQFANVSEMLAASGEKNAEAMAEMGKQIQKLAEAAASSAPSESAAPAPIVVPAPAVDVSELILAVNALGDRLESIVSKPTPMQFSTEALEKCMRDAVAALSGDRRRANSSTLSGMGSGGSSVQLQPTLAFAEYQGAHLPLHMGDKGGLRVEVSESSHLLNASNDSVTFAGRDANDVVHPVAVDSSGNVAIRPLTYERDSIAVSGSVIVENPFASEKCLRAHSAQAAESAERIREAICTNTSELRYALHDIGQVLTVAATSLEELLGLQRESNRQSDVLRAVSAVHRKAELSRAPAISVVRASPTPDSRGPSFAPPHPPAAPTATPATPEPVVPVAVPAVPTPVVPVAATPATPAAPAAPAAPAVPTAPEPAVPPPATPAPIAPVAVPAAPEPAVPPPAPPAIPATPEPIAAPTPQVAPEPAAPAPAAPTAPEPVPAPLAALELAAPAETTPQAAAPEVPAPATEAKSAPEVAPLPDVPCVPRTRGITPA